MKMYYLLLALMLTLCSQQTVTCEGNRFLFQSTYLLGRQADLSKAFIDINQTAKIDEITYKDELFRTYKIFNVTQNISYSEVHQDANLTGLNTLLVTNGSGKVVIAFQWEKKQLGSSLYGNGTASVSTDIITYQKTLETNSSNELQWYMSKADPIAITNGISLSTIFPFKEQDYQTLSNMLNKLKTNQTTIKDNLLKAINLNYSQILSQKVLEDSTPQFPKTYSYSYADYHGEIIIPFTNKLLNSSLANEGLSLLFSQTITDDETFECGEKVPFEHDDISFGGLQEFISNNFFKSCLEYVVSKGRLDVVLGQQFWQNRAFQFYVGDLHEVMPITKNISSMVPVNGSCDAIKDSSYSFTPKSSSTYQLILNFSCSLNLQSPTEHILNLTTLVTYTIKPTLEPSLLNFQISNILAKSSFIEFPHFKIEYKELADFMVGETLNLCKNILVIGSGYKGDKPVVRRDGRIGVKDKYLFLYDSGVRKTKQLIVL